MKIKWLPTLTFCNGRLRVIHGDLTKAKDVQAIVNAANMYLTPGGGVDGAIHQAAGPDLARATRGIGMIEPGEAVMTSGFKLYVPYVIHAVGPIWTEHDPRMHQVFTKTYENIFNMMKTNKIKTVAIPNISTSAYGFPKVLAAHLAIKAIVDFLNDDASIERIDCYCFEEDNYRIYQDTLVQLNF